ncbi:MAG: hypothetical protein EFT35_05870 [Methanophagales archaeon ANME-1-THS]|nr:MAG: hypothetical protein EFT35_05870 [Methanophagales archaeon ANME-1-THS]
MIETTWIEEPELYFANNKDSIDPKIGLLKFGPYGTFSHDKTQSKVIRAGVIATKNSVMLLESWLERLRERIPGKYIESEKRKEIDFPGLSVEKALNFDIEIDDACIEYIDEKEIDSLEKLERKERVAESFKIYEQKFKDLEASTDPNPDLVLLPLSEKLLKLCKIPDIESDNIIYEYRTFDSKKSYDEYLPGFDFHNVIKVLGYKYGNIATQVIKPRTLTFKGDQTPATLAWNFAVAAYYKGTGIPWKLANIDEETCYVGISFYPEITPDKRVMRSSMAHVYLKTGESQVIRGKPFNWDDTMGKSPSLSQELANDIICDVIDLYKRQRRGALPKRVVVHKTSHFTEDEQHGFNEALENIEIVDFVHIISKMKIMAFPRGDYPALRGTMVIKGDESLLYTSGFVPALDTYMGASVPQPLLLRLTRLESTPKQIGKDILALTKLDWNNADFNTREPVTISVSQKVGEVLSESIARGIKNPPSNYRYYM